MRRLADEVAAREVEKGSLLCVNVDVSSPHADSLTERVVRLIAQISDYACAVKVNEKFTLGLQTSHHKRIVRESRDRGLLTIFDAKVCDVTSSCERAIEWVGDVGYDAVTLMPFFGNLRELVAKCRERRIYSLVVCAPSQPSSAKYYRASLGSLQLFEAIAEEAKESGADGIVVGATGMVSEGEITSLRRRVGEDMVILFVGIGAQGGDVRTVTMVGGDRVVVAVGRSIVESGDPTERARAYRDEVCDSRCFYVASEAILNSCFMVDVERGFELRSGVRSPFYIDLRMLYSKPKLRERVARLVAGYMLRKLGRKPDKVVTTATAGIPIASIVSEKLGVGLAYVRGERKSYGTGKLIEGEVSEGELVAGVDDVTTTGSTAEACVKATREAGAVITDYFVVLDRDEGAKGRLERLGVRLNSLVTVGEDFIEMARRLGRLSSDKLDLVKDYIRKRAM